MYLKSGIDYYLLNLKDLTITCKSGNVLVSPNLKFKLLSYPDLNKIEMMESSGMKESTINEEIVSKCLISILGFEDEELDIDNSPAGIIDHLATKIKLNSFMLIKDLEQSYQAYFNSLAIMDRLIMVVAHYTNNTYEFTQALPIDEIIKRYTLCSVSFSGVPPIEFQEEQESKVG